MPCSGVYHADFRWICRRRVELYGMSVHFSSAVVPCGRTDVDRMPEAVHASMPGGSRAWGLSSIQREDQSELDGEGHRDGAARRPTSTYRTPAAAGPASFRGSKSSTAVARQGPISGQQQAATRIPSRALPRRSPSVTSRGLVPRPSPCRPHWSRQRKLFTADRRRRHRS